MQTDMILEKELGVLHLDPEEQKGSMSHTRHNLRIGDLRASPPQ